MGSLTFGELIVGTGILSVQISMSRLMLPFSYLVFQDKKGCTPCVVVRHIDADDWALRDVVEHADGMRGGVAKAKNPRGEEWDSIHLQLHRDQGAKVYLFVCL